jgi:hypothetical protein
MSKPNDCVYPDYKYKESDKKDVHAQAVGGLTKRELIAAMALQGQMANASWRNEQQSNTLIKWAVQYADALILELDKDK